MANASDDLYCEPIADLSQCDIVEISPHAYLDPPLRCLDDLPDGKMAVRTPPVHEIARGAGIVALCSPRRALIVNYDCEIAKPDVVHLVICPLVPLSEFPSEHRGNIKRNKTAHLFFLPRFQGKIEDSAV